MDSKSSTAKLVLFAGCGVSLVLVAISDIAQTNWYYDESYYLRDVQLLQDYGLGREFLRKLQGPAGPAYPVIHGLLVQQPMLHKTPHRIVNIAFFGLAAIFTHFLHQRWRRDGPAWLGAEFLIFPATVFVTICALTDMPALCFHLVATVLLIAALNTAKLPLALILAFGGGSIFAVATLARQPLLISLGATLFFLQDRRTGVILGLYWVAALWLPLTVFMQWQGLVPPATAWVASGLLPQHFFLGCGYAGLAALLYSPRWFWIGWRWLIVSAFLALLLAVGTGAPSNVPAGNLVAVFARGPALFVWSCFVTFCIFTLGIVLLFSLGEKCFREINEPSHDTRRLVLFLIATVILLLAPAVVITHLFSAKYVVPALPYLSVLVRSSKPPDPWYWLRAAIGLSAGVSYTSVILFRQLG